jgi:hypothetical protein
MANILVRCLVLAAAFGLAACGGLPEFSSPLGPLPGVSRMHDRLVGLWVWRAPEKRPDEANLFHIRSDGKDGLFGNFVHTSVEGKKLLVLRLSGRGHVTELGGEYFLNFRRLEGSGDNYTAPGLEPGYSILKIRFDGDDLLRVQLTPEPALRKLFKAGRLKGRMVEGSNLTGKVSYQYVTVSTEEFRRFLGEVDHGEFFGEWGAFRRIERAPYTNLHK